MGMFHGGDMKNVTEDSKSVKKRGRDDGKKKQTDLIVAREKITTGGAEMKVVSMLKGTVHQNDGKARCGRIAAAVPSQPHQHLAQSPPRG